jgi:AcrR family transcriptional regulator
MPRAEHPPQQARSRATLQRLLDAAEAVMIKHGVEGTTLPRIARRARVAPATVYRRFRNKEALMRAVFRRFNERSRGAVREQFDADRLRGLGLVPFATQVVQGMVQGFRANAALSRAAVLYAEKNPKADFIRQSGESERKSFQQMVDTFLLWRDQINHSDPERAIRLAFLVIASTLRDLVIFDRMRLMVSVIPVDDEALKRELPRVFLGCLGVRPPD